MCIRDRKGVYRESRIHALNQKEIGIRYAASRGNKYEEMNLIICHIGGGISVTAHQKGKMVDSNDIAQGDGPMAPTRCGAIPVKEVMKACFTGNCTEKELYEKITKSGGLVDHLGTSEMCIRDRYTVMNISWCQVYGERLRRRLQRTG